MKKILAVLLVLIIATPIFAVDYNTMLQKAEEGNANAQFTLGYMYYHGIEVVQDYAAAAKWYRQSAKQDNASAQYYLGYIYYSGQGVAQDYAEAAKWYRQAAAQGNADAQLNMGNM